MNITVPDAMIEFNSPEMEKMKEMQKRLGVKTILPCSEHPFGGFRMDQEIPELAIDRALSALLQIVEETKE